MKFGHVVQTNRLVGEANGDGHLPFRKLVFWLLWFWWHESRY